MVDEGGGLEDGGLEDMFCHFHLCDLGQITLTSLGPKFPNWKIGIVKVLIA